MIDTTKTVTGVNVDNEPLQLAGGNLGTKTITENGTYSASSDSLDGFSSVTVNVSGSGGEEAFQEYLETKGNANYLFADMTDLTDEQLVDIIFPALIFSSCTEGKYMFKNCTSLTYVNNFDTSNMDDVTGMFYGCTDLCFVGQGNDPLDLSMVEDATNMFYGCTSLEQINITGLHCDLDISASTQYSAEDLTSILDNLPDLTADEMTATLTMGATNLAKLDQMDIDDAEAKGWTIV